MTPAADRFTGCLIGQCLGDALGFIVEGQPPAACRNYVETLMKSGGAEKGRRGPFAFGQYSDDSQLARELMRSYAEKGRFDAADYATRIAAIFTENRIVGRGRATEEAALRLAAGVAWEKAGTPPPSAGNGSAMRAGPVGLMFYDDAAALIAAARDQGRITHADPRCSAGAVAIAGAVALAMDDAPLEASAFLGQLADWAGSVDSAMADAVGRLVSWLPLPPDEAVTFISRAGLAEGFRDVWTGISPFVIGSVLWSLYSFLRSPDDYWRSVRTAIAVGGDVDTTAAMTGAIAGARNGLAAIPAGLARRLNDQGTWDYDDLTDLANRVWLLKTGKETP
ncbi:MAG: ADP-ribosylglycohydrolase family protein [Rhodospirillales bacterium]|jgi:ADP-ribosylglycohydrolase|nr:ADP-ribosylglycohydrolase family protein [Rhodospirillales bacterium]HIJ43414.1 ADP-ribosylglycohydrolase family protein [Rhodospirillaceae bacterium]HIJ44580.1 ADP-ribosylglycohydrolase family protein [Rhodospirillaceae bacterium]HIJ93153.1 ADP-ribosylglycohydrolase family protein [Rhodospirillaceae bacterium]HJP53223.1 ADP-ribosylglycohydrolase family protein [Rhodospirillales bacterium]